MTTSPPRRAALRWLGAFLTLLAAALLAPGSARAGCVHDALQRTLEPTGSAHFRLLVETGAMQVDRAAEDDAIEPIQPEAPEPTRPCSGPTCSNDSGTPSAPGLTLPPATGSWACLDAPRADDAPGSRLRPDAASRPRPLRCGLDVFHPPRAAFA